ncbi:MAG: hypothetical protein J6N21_22960 [Butyrivibrio sp.]|nr:hypothetical protein [Butyrivibrio sp.]
MTDYRDNLEIDLKNLAVDILKKWKLLLAGMVVGCLLGALYLVSRSVVGVDDSEKPAILQNVSEQDAVALAMKLSVKEKSDADLAFAAYKKALELNDQVDLLSPEAQVELIKATEDALTAGSAFTTDQKAYYRALFASDPELASAVVADTAENEENITTQQANNADAKSLFKNGAVGAFAGLFIACIVIALKYILTPVIKTEDDLRTGFKLPVIGNIDPASEASTALIYSRIAGCAQKNDAKKIYLVSSSDDAIITSNRDKMSSMFEGKDISVIAGGSMFTDPAVIDEIVTSDGVILFEKIGKSFYEDIAREIELCNNYGVPIMGTVVIK